MEVTDEAKNWMLLEPGMLNLIGTGLCVCHIRRFGGTEPYHIYSLKYPLNCYGTFDNPEDAKKRTLQVYVELIEMGVDP